jgi:hypothetical protein
MNAEQLFSAANIVALLGWLGLLLLPRVRLITDLVAQILVPCLLACAYIVLVARSLDPADFASFSSLAGLAALQAKGGQWLTLVGWMHYLAFDLFVGAWQVRTARREDIPHLAIVPALLLTFMLGPFGLLVFVVTRYFYRRRIRAEEAV